MRAFGINHNSRIHRDVATNSGLGDQVQIGTFFVNLHRVNNIEHNIKRYVQTGMEVIFFIHHDTVYKNNKNKNVLINKIKYTLSIIS